MADEALPAAEDVVEAHLIACINENLSAFLYDNACFLCERLVASQRSQVSMLCHTHCWSFLVKGPLLWLCNMLANPTL